MNQSLLAPAGRKGLYVVAPEIATGHVLASATQLSGGIDEEQVHISGLLARVPVTAGPGGALTEFGASEIDLSRSPMNRLQAIVLKLVDETGNLVDLRGYSFQMTVELKCKTF